MGLLQRFTKLQKKKENKYKMIKIHQKNETKHKVQ